MVASCFSTASRQKRDRGTEEMELPTFLRATPRFVVGNAVVDANRRSHDDVGGPFVQYV
jgi:hypothetical protein